MAILTADIPQKKLADTEALQNFKRENLDASVAITRVWIEDSVPRTRQYTLLDVNETGIVNCETRIPFVGVNSAIARITRDRGGRTVTIYEQASLCKALENPKQLKAALTRLIRT